MHAGNKYYLKSLGDSYKYNTYDVSKKDEGKWKTATCPKHQRTLVILLAGID